MDLTMMLLHVASLLAALPFLPQGKGALILIFGGLAVLPVSLLWSTMASGTQWAAGIEPGAARLGLTSCRMVSATAYSCVVALAHCPSCHIPGRAPGPCESERKALLEAVTGRAPHASVIEVSCNRSGRGACTFVIQRGRSA